MTPYHPYLNTIFKVSEKYFGRVFTEDQLANFKAQCYKQIRGDKRSTIDQFISLYCSTVKDMFQANYTEIDHRLADFLESDKSKMKILWGNCLDFMKSMKSESVQLMVTSPPYYNARDYSNWDNLDDYLIEMESIIKESFRVLDNHRPFVFNVGDIFDNDHKHTRSSWGKRRIPLGAYFTSMFENVGFHFVDDFIWDKGEVQSQRHKNGLNPFPLYQYPVNCYEHIFIFYKHRLDETLYPCPICGCLKVNGNAYSGVGVKSWECKNLDCMERSEGNRGKRFSYRSYVMNGLKSNCNIIEADLLKVWRRDLVQFPPVIKINCNGENSIGHTAPYPREIPVYATKVFSGLGETVLDPFAGSFTTAIEATKLGRHGVGIELNKDLFRESILSNASNQLQHCPIVPNKPWIEYDHAS